ncbi:transposase [Variovorax sp. J22R115]|uniref:IS66-like element accessory protein TnpA n=1 Tax=Variovorax sp. J22R115 TaxID=3053509 RepID=UPI0025783D60|nr:transposase [Variovorax sp. J22R115]MDM0050619.1 transposase [Variovorax sp. J22R115]
MSERLEELAGRLVIGRKRDGRSVYDEQAKAELVAECAKPGVSVSGMARQAGVNANQLSRWVREHGDRQRAIAVAREPAQAAFVPVAIQAQPAATPAPPLCLHARLPNGVAIDISACALPQAVQLIEALGRLPCSASTKG